VIAQDPQNPTPHDRCKHAVQTLCRAAAQSCASLHQGVYQWAQEDRRPRHIRSSPTPENVVVQSKLAFDSWPPLSPFPSPSLGFVLASPFFRTGRGTRRTGLKSLALAVWPEFRDQQVTGCGIEIRRRTVIFAHSPASRAGATQRSDRNRLLFRNNGRSADDYS
jgi:hypothetical protein